MIDTSYLVDRLSAYVATPSINPAFDSNGSEAPLAAIVAADLEDLGIAPQMIEPEPGRTSVVGLLPGSGDGASLMLYAHLDTVGVEGMEAPFEPVVRDGRLYGRGAYDMKAGLAACMTAAKALRDMDGQLAGDVLVVAVADEEEASVGMQAVLEQFRADAAIVTEPTELQLCLAHKGFAWVEVERSLAPLLMAASSSAVSTPTCAWVSYWYGWPGSNRRSASDHPTRCWGRDQCTWRASRVAPVGAPMQRARWRRSSADCCRARMAGWQCTTLRSSSGASRRLLLI